MALQMLSVEVSLGTMRAWKFSVRILLGNHGILARSSAGGSGGPARSTGQNATASLRSNHVSWLLAFLHDRLLMGHERALAVRRRHAGLSHHTAGGHWAQNGRTGRRGRRRDGLGVGGSDGRLRHHRGRCSIALVGLLRVRVRHHVLIASTSTLRRRRVVAHVAVGRSGWVGSARRVRVATVHGLHSRVVRLQRRQCVRREMAVL